MPIRKLSWGIYNRECLTLSRLLLRPSLIPYIPTYGYIAPPTPNPLRHCDPKSTLFLNRDTISTVYALTDTIYNRSTRYSDFLVHLQTRFEGPYPQPGLIADRRVYHEIPNVDMHHLPVTHCVRGAGWRMRCIYKQEYSGISEWVDGRPVGKCESVERGRYQDSGKSRGYISINRNTQREWKWEVGSKQCC